MAVDEAFALWHGGAVILAGIGLVLAFYAWLVLSAGKGDGNGPED